MTGVQWIFVLMTSAVIGLLVMVAVSSVLEDPRSPEIREAHDEWRH